MRLPISINHLLHGKAVEWERLEFKAGWNPQDILHTICAFANDFHNLGGGYILVGVTENDGRLVLPVSGLGVSHLNNIQQEILKLGHNAIQPQYHPIVIPELDITEGRSTGIPKILHTMKANGSPPPEFEFDEDHTYFMCRLPVHTQATMPEGLIDESDKASGEKLGKGWVKTRVKTRVETRVKPGTLFSLCLRRIRVCRLRK